MRTFLISFFALSISSLGTEPGPRKAHEVRKFSAAEAHQGVAVDEKHFYAVTNRGIGKYDKQTGQNVARWNAPADSHLKHLNSGIVIDGKLYCAHSNWPAKPLRNSIEIWDAKSLKYLRQQELKQETFALNWVDRRDGYWWVVFARYGTKEVVSGTKLVKYDDDWKPVATWRFPEKVVERFIPSSCSGGGFGPDGLIYATGHDRAEMYALQIPKDGETLKLIETIPINIEGQGIAWDRSDNGVVYGIRRKSKEVVVSRIISAQ